MNVIKSTIEFILTELNGSLEIPYLAYIAYYSTNKLCFSNIIENCIFISFRCD